MAARTEADRLITTPERIAPPQFIAVAELCGAESYFITRTTEDTAQMWYWENYQGPDGEDPTHDRDFSVAELEEVVTWLGTKASREENERRRVGDLGEFFWSDDDIYLLLPCGDDYTFTLPILRLFIRAFRRMEIAGDQPLVVPR